jgi:hypothetical protein
MSRLISVFFYGSFMRPDVLANSDVHPASFDIARLSGYDIALDPHANLYPHPFECVYGILIRASHAQLDRLYGTNGVGAFLPEAVLVTVNDARWLPALCFIPPSRNKQGPDPAYLERLIEAAHIRGLPPDYIARLEKFKTHQV